MMDVPRFIEIVEQEAAMRGDEVQVEREGLRITLLRCDAGIWTALGFDVHLGRTPKERHARVISRKLLTELQRMVDADEPLVEEGQEAN